MSTVVIIIIVLLLLGAFGAAPVWPHSASWGPWPSSLAGTILVILVILLLLGKL